jgi:hypothetical protein
MALSVLRKRQPKKITSRSEVVVVWIFPSDTQGYLELYGVFSTENNAITALRAEEDNLQKNSMEYKIGTYIVDYRLDHPAVKYWKGNRD